MKKLKRIIVGIDTLGKPNNVLKRALMLAKENKAELYIVHAIQISWFSVPDYFGSKEIVIDKKAIKKKIEKKIKALNADTKVPCFVLVKEGDPDDIILYESKLLRADMIVIGSHLKSKTRKNILGTTAQKVAQQSHLPVLIVKNKVKKTYKNILVPTDFGMQSKQSVIFVKNIFPASKINTVHAYEAFYVEGFYTAGPYALEGRDLVQYKKLAKTHAENSLKEYLQEVGVKKGKVIDGEGNTKEALLEYIKKGSYDLVVVGSRGTSGFKALLGSAASYISKEAPNDVLIFVPKD
ncbi:MAG: universal stress protein [Campylobacterota bacterium]|nr:universal stress protein [Campylobacterota bacterium]